MTSRSIFLLVLFLGGLSIIAAFRAARSSSETHAASLPAGAPKPGTANAELEKAVRSLFNGDEELRNAQLRIEADVTKNEVSLSGIVASNAIRARAVDLAKTAQVGVIVNDRLTVVSPGRPSGSP